MEVFQGFLLLVFSLIGQCAGQRPVLVQCNPSYLVVTVSRTLFENDDFVEPHELHLGTGCLATYNLMYGIVIYTWLTYHPFMPITAQLDVHCTIHRSCVQLSMSAPNTAVDSTLSVSRYLKEWYLVQKRYCERCRQNYSESWSVPFYGITYYISQNSPM